MSNSSQLTPNSSAIKRLLLQDVTDVGDEADKEDDFSPEKDFFSRFQRQNV
ncbi:hypothetical protein GCM10028817_14430 [Spirosoma pomorum]